MSLLWSSDGGDGSLEPRKWRDDARSRRAQACSDGGWRLAMTDVAVRPAPDVVLYKIPEVMRMLQMSRGDFLCPGVVKDYQPEAHRDDLMEDFGRAQQDDSPDWFMTIS